MGGDQWTSKTNWLSNNHHRTWYGVTTDSSTDNAYVLELDLYGNDLSNGPIPTQVGQLTSLNVLSFYATFLTGPIPTEVGQLTALNTLFLTRNALNGPIPTEVGQLTSLNTLFLMSNALTGPIPTQVGQMTSLLRLDLDHNALTGSIPVVVCDLLAGQTLQADCVNCNQSKSGCCSYCFIN